MIKAFTLSTLALSALAGGALAQTSYNTPITPGWFPGTGQPNSAFVANNNVPLSAQTGLSSFYRWGIRGPGDFTLRDSLVVDTYTYRAGESYTDGTASAFQAGTASWNFSYHVNLNTLGTGSIGQNLANNTVLLTIDWDPGVGVDTRTYNFSTYATSLGLGSLTLIQDSLNFGFAFWDNPTFLAATGSTARTSAFDPNALGTYRITLDVIRGGNNISSVTEYINIVPTPGAATLAGLGLLGALRRRR
jgi:hypothetical protein